MKRADIIAAARQDLGTPYHHQGRLAGVGLDCLGLVVVVADRLGVKVQDKTDYGFWPDDEVILAELSKQLIRVPVDQAKPGDLILLSIAGSAQHMGFLTNTNPMTLIHSLAVAPIKKVVEQPMGQVWVNRIHSVWQVPGVED